MCVCAEVGVSQWDYLHCMCVCKWVVTVGAATAQKKKRTVQEVYDPTEPNYTERGHISKCKCNILMYFNTKVGNLALAGKLVKTMKELATQLHLTHVEDRSELATSRLVLDTITYFDSYSHSSDRWSFVIAHLAKLLDHISKDNQSKRANKIYYKLFFLENVALQGDSLHNLSGCFFRIIKEEIEDVRQVIESVEMQSEVAKTWKQSLLNKLWLLEHVMPECDTRFVAEQISSVVANLIALSTCVRLPNAGCSSGVFKMVAEILFTLQ